MSFFDYPDTKPEAPPQAAVLLPDASEADWATLLEFTRALRFGAGQNVLEVGSGGRLLHVLLEGTLEVLVSRDHAISPAQLHGEPVGGHGDWNGAVQELAG